MKPTFFKKLKINQSALKVIFLIGFSFLIPFILIANQTCEECIIDSALNLDIIFFCGLIPTSIILFIFREPLKDFGVSFGDKKIGLFSIVFFPIYLTPFLLLIQFIPNVSMYYSMSNLTNIGSFLLFSLKLGVGMFFWEFFFRGFLLFGLYKIIGKITLPLLAVPFALAHLGKPPIEIVVSFFAALLLGHIAIKSKSFLPAFFIHWIIAVELTYLVNF
jgi:hypothetical protein